ncbi:MAG: fumarate hydratase [Candidatus Omnitrophota bacterium]
MKTISADKIKKAVEDLCIRANLFLRKDVLLALRRAYREERNGRARRIIAALIKNADVASSEGLAICQDTGMPVVFLEIGQNVRVSGNLQKAVNRGIESGYRKGALRNSVVREPLSRKKAGFTPGIIHTDIVEGDKLKVTVLPKGFGCENKAQLKMFNPTAEWREIKEFIISAVKNAGPDACPPYIVGVGIGGTADYAMFLAKKSLLSKVPNARKAKSKIEKELLDELNKLRIGPMGLGGDATVLAVHISTFPTHIAGLPVAVNISCHALRSQTKIL